MSQNYPIHYRTWIIASAFLVYLTTAYFSVGYFHPDEHFQILEFANYKKGVISGYELPWEYAMKIRPTFQPWVAYIVMKACGLLKMDDPYVIALILRTFTAILAVVSIDRFVRSSIRQFQTGCWMLFYFWSFFLWFLPVISIRFSSESWSGLLFMLALAQVNSKEELSRLTLSKAGLLLGLSFLCRFQSGIMFGGLFLWLLIIKKAPLKDLSYLFLSWTGILIIGVFLDKLFYGGWTLTSWNYFHVNIVMDIASDFGKVQWYRYIGDIILDAVAPIGLILLMAYLVLLFREPKNMIIWVVTPFLFVHLIIPHKEIRFLFPIAGYFPYIVFKAFQSLNYLHTDKPDHIRTGLIKKVAVCFLATNIAALIISIFIAPSNGRIVITKFIYDHYKSSEMQMYALHGNDPFIPFKSLRQSYYDMPQLKHNTIRDYSGLENVAFAENSINLFVIRRRDLLKDPALGSRLAKLKFKEVKSGNPGWATKLYSFYNSGAQLAEYKLYTNK